ncbi:peptide chain release factor N(5)-glutamine methyltransferase [Nitratireductor indicus]|uniref:Release factor glutamine methyltransferase n=1 Tax=Nitratireductor indicus C115 TaxID=1231190 RepID=K2MYX5_9HYPH|nr:peptide chain release factor N(5)-glutamine methyltransferase [Nitratireductor indicus]EKF40463.1 N5-glutamine S-adenosyl-L-methionine-dependent methyltransferase [Nitratireductor indicus C115]MDS1136295.1 peptide chain release factor N(5)-glutamine methyltransferase [Nitratireductor indicus]SFQ76761.1 release factor glutamine methyltransferase [Nitratireductor indicus]
MAEARPTLGMLHAEARARLAQAGIEDAALDARLLVEHFTKSSRTDALVRPELEIAAPSVSALDEALARRILGMPVHRIMGQREFYGLTLGLSDETLEPRPDTEILVDLVLGEARQEGGEDRPYRILDLGTGSGAIAIALLSALPSACAIGADISEDALATARRNADMNGVGGRFVGLRSDWFSEIEGRFDFIVSNPPYIREHDWKSLSREVRDFDPRKALVGGVDGLDAYRAIAQGCHGHLATGGRVAVEIGYDQKEAVTRVFKACAFRRATAAKDLAGHNRALIFHAEKTP